MLDLYVRDGLVYYRAVKSDRAALDRFVDALDVAPQELTGWSRAAQQAFWINAYNALVLRTIVDAYPIQGKSPDYPETSVRQIPGAFERTKHRVAGQSLTLDEIETGPIAGFGDARMILALGRGARGSGRLRSEAYRAEKPDTQLNEAVAECAERVSCVRIDRATNTLEVTPIIGWRAALFEKAFVSQAGARWPKRSPIERAVAAMIAPHMFPSEREFLEADTFHMTYGTFDWELNLLGTAAADAWTSR